jgi:hypothetical protein
MNLEIYERTVEHEERDVKQQMELKNKLGKHFGA